MMEEEVINLDDLSIEIPSANESTKSKEKDDYLNNFEKELNNTASHADLNIPNEDDEVETRDVDPNKDLEAKGKKSLSKLVKPSFAINTIDYVLPTIFATVVIRMGYWIDKKKLKLDDEDKEALKPFVEDFLETIQINFDNPYQNLAFGLILVYGVKFAEVFPEIKKQKPVIKETDIVSFEKEYNENIKRIMKEEKKKTLLAAKKYFSDFEPQRLVELLDKYNIEFRDIYLNPTNK